MTVVWRTTGRGVGVGVATTIPIVVICGVGCAVVVEGGGCVGEIPCCTGISTWFATWVGRTSLSGLLVLSGEETAYIPEAMITKQRNITAKNFLLLRCVCLLRGISSLLSFGKDTVSSYLVSLLDSCCSCSRLANPVADES